MTHSFTDNLRAEAEPTWSDAVQHRFIRELCDGSVPDAVMGAYLVQDSRFLDAFLMLLGGAMASADTAPARLRFGRFAGMVAGEENSYFERSFQALGLDRAAREQVPDTAATAGFKAIMREAAVSLSYPAVLAVLNVAEGLYLDWAARAPRPLPRNFIHAEWITLHDNPDFRDFVGFLRAELDRVGPGDAAIAREFFLRAVGLERDFFDAAYDPAFHLAPA
ncbi:TenA family protein [Paracoccus sp. DMF-8]|uniref:TenA family protein n=1 Tax=Paracoccus sp. DMF-8 TaxID=3019445 RepID=UPI0023E46C76|nr:TenA family protein [Paracoccus sp. DMF-8]MDF3607392.1 TenA family protein [Paracoccus sp. DMF-8]